MRAEHWLYTIPLRLRSLFRRTQADQELDDELRDHVERKTDEYVAKGISPQEARRQAFLEMGGIEQRKEECRDTRRVNWLQDLLQDIRFGLRMLRQSPGFALIAIATISLGVGATTAIYSVIDATLLHPLPYPNPSELIHVQDDLPGIDARDVGISIPEWRDLESSGIFQSVSIAGHGASVNVTGSAQPLRLGFKAVTPNYFDAPRCRRAAGPHLRSTRCHSRLQPGSRD